MMTYFALIIAFMQRYQPSAGLGTLVATMLPYSMTFRLEPLAGCPLPLASHENRLTEALKTLSEACLLLGFGTSEYVMEHGQLSLSVSVNYRPIEGRLIQVPVLYRHIVSTNAGASLAPISA